MAPVLPNPDVSIALRFRGPGKTIRSGQIKSYVNDLHRIVTERWLLDLFILRQLRGRMRQRRIGPEIFREIRGDVLAVLLVDIFEQITKAGAHVIDAIVPPSFVPYLCGHPALESVAPEAGGFQLVSATPFGQKLRALIDREIGPV